MSFQIRISVQAQRDIQEILAWTYEHFGAHQYVVYRDLIREALIDLATNPEIARRRPELHPTARTLHLARRGRRARHFLLLRLTDDGVVEIGRLLYDGMDFPEHLPEAYRREDDSA